MRRSITPFIIAALFGAFYHAPALAYIGPGAGITILGALWGVVVAIVLALVAVLVWPVRILFRRSRGVAKGTAAEPTADMSEADAGEPPEDDLARQSCPGTAAKSE